MYNLYAAFNVTDNMYVKAGMLTVDVITNEDLEQVLLMETQH